MVEVKEQDEEEKKLEEAKALLAVEDEKKLEVCNEEIKVVLEKHGYLLEITRPSLILVKKK